MNHERLIAMAARRVTALWQVSQRLGKAKDGEKRDSALNDLAVALKANKLEEWEQDIADTPMGETP